MQGCRKRNFIKMEKEEKKILVHEEILQKVEETCELQSKKEKFNINILSGELQDFFSEELKEINLPLYRRINRSNNADKGLHPSTIGHAWDREGKPVDGATQNLRDLLCYYAFKMDWSDTLESLGTSEEEETQRTKEKREEYKCKKKGKPFISKSDAEIRLFANRIYIELITRKAGIPIDEKNDVIEELYNSWYKLFCIIRDEIKALPIDCLKDQSNPELAQGISISILNDLLRPHLTEHQAKYRSWLAEAKQDPKNKGITPQDLQKKYPDYKILMKSLKETNNKLIESAEKLSLIAGQE
jgi:hypothetical protein